MSDSQTSHASKKAKTTPKGTPLWSDIDLSKLTIDTTPQGAEIKHATVKYDGGRPTFQLEAATGSLRCPFGVDDGSKFSGKPSLNIELPSEQLAFFQDQLEAKVKDAAVANKDAWFGAIKPLPSDDAIHTSFNSRIKVDEAGKYPATLKVNINLSEGPKKVQVLTSRRLADGKITKPKPATTDAVVRGARVVPVLRTAGGVWISVNAKKKTFEYGLVFEAYELLVIEETEAAPSFNFDGVGVVSSDDDQDKDNGEANAEDGGYDALGA